jgi:hypothetical protein
LSDIGVLNPERQWTYATNASAAEQVANRAVLDAIAAARHHENPEVEIAAIIQIAEKAAWDAYTEGKHDQRGRHRLTGDDMTIDELLVKIPLFRWPIAVGNGCYNIPPVSEDATTDTVVPYLSYSEHVRPIEIPPDADGVFLAQIAESYIRQPCQVSGPHRPIRTGDMIQMITASDAQVRQEVQLHALREEDRMLPPSPTPSTPPTVQQVPNQAPPPAHSRAIQLPWEIAKPELAAHECVFLTLDLVEAIQEPSQRKAYLTRNLDSS